MGKQYAFPYTGINIPAGRAQGLSRCGSFSPSRIYGNNNNSSDDGGDGNDDTPPNFQ